MCVERQLIREERFAAALWGQITMAAMKQVVRLVLDVMKAVLFVWLLAVICPARLVPEAEEDGRIGADGGQFSSVTTGRDLTTMR